MYPCSCFCFAVFAGGVFHAGRRIRRKYTDHLEDIDGCYFQGEAEPAGAEFYEDPDIRAYGEGARREAGTD